MSILSMQNWSECQVAQNDISPSKILTRIKRAHMNMLGCSTNFRYIDMYNPLKVLSSSLEEHIELFLKTSFEHAVNHEIHSLPVFSYPLVNHHNTAQQCVLFELKKLKMNMMFENSFKKFKCF